jgi:hypothetical protein
MKQQLSGTFSVATLTDWRRQKEISGKLDAQKRTRDTNIDSNIDAHRSGTKTKGKTRRDETRHKTTNNKQGKYENMKE